jgi:hypothetical protein
MGALSPRLVGGFKQLSLIVEECGISLTYPKVETVVHYFIVFSLKTIVFFPARHV